MSTVRANGEIFDVLLDGVEKAPVLMLSNSIGSDMGMWDAQIPALRKHFRVVRYNSRGHHPSSTSDQPYTFEQLGQDALEIMNALDIGSAHWCGVSMGGVIGQWLALHAPRRLNRMVLANTAAYLGPPEKWQGRIDVVKREGTKAIADASVERWFTPGFREAQPETVARIKNMLLNTPARAYAGGSAALRDVDLRDRIHAIRQPTLVIGGRHDSSTPLEDARYLHQQIQGSSLLELDAAHLSNIERSEEFTAAVLRFLMV